MTGGVIAAAPVARIAHLIDVERWDDARRTLGEALRLAPDDVELLYLAARVESGDGKLDEAERLTDAVLARSPSHEATRELRFGLLCKRRRYAEAEAVILERLRESPEEARLFVAYARLMFTTLHLEKARALTDEALRLEPGSAPARLLDALLSVVEGRRDGARARLAELVREDPDGEAVTRTLFAVLVTERRYPAALEIARELLRLRPDDPDLVDALVELRSYTHWTSKPLWPLVRFRWAGLIAVWAGGAFGLAALRKIAPAVAGPLYLVYFAYVIYSWCHLALLQRWLRWRGF